MNVHLDAGQIVGLIIVFLVGQAIVQGISYIVFRTQAQTWHAANTERFTKIEGALGLIDPDAVAFARRSELEKVERDVEDHEGRIGVLERRRT